jgi:hypothetical protein
MVSANSGASVASGCPAGVAGAGDSAPSALPMARCASSVRHGQRARLSETTLAAGLAPHQKLIRVAIVAILEGEDFARDLAESRLIDDVVEECEARRVLLAHALRITRLLWVTDNAGGRRSPAWPTQGVFGAGESAGGRGSARPLVSPSFGARFRVRAPDHACALWRSSTEESWRPDRVGRRAKRWHQARLANSERFSREGSGSAQNETGM